MVTGAGRGGPSDRRDQVRPDDTAHASEHGVELDAWLAERAAVSSATGSRSTRPTPAAWSTWRRCGSRRSARGGRSLPAAGLPWFMAIFGRDSIFTSLQALPFAPELAATTLRELGARQGTRIDDFRDEEPGRILHELRYGELTAFEERPHSPYYGSCRRDAAVRRAARRVRAMDRATSSSSRELETEARAALRWIDEYGDRTATATSSTSAATRRPGSRTSAGRTRGIRSRSRRPAARACPAQPASSRGTRTTPRCAAPVSPARSGTTPASRNAGAAGCRPQAAVQPGLLGRRRRVLRARAGRRRPPGRRAHVQHRASAVERHRRRARAHPPSPST